MRLIKKLIELSAALVVGTVAVAVILVSLFLVVSQNHQFESEGFPAVIEPQLEAIFGKGRVAVESASIGLGDNGINVEMAFRYFDSDGDEEFVFPKVRSTLSLGSLALGKIRLRSLEVLGLEIVVVRNEAGGLDLPSLPGVRPGLGQGLGTGIDELFDSGPLRHLDSLELTDSSIEFAESVAGTTHRFVLPRLRLTRNQGRLDVTALVRFQAGEQDGDLELEVSMSRTPATGGLEIFSRLDRPPGGATDDEAGKTRLEGFLPISTSLVIRDREPGTTVGTSNGGDVPENGIAGVSAFPFDATISSENGNLSASGNLSFRMNGNSELESLQISVQSLVAQLGLLDGQHSHLDIPKGGFDLILFPSSRRVEVNRAWISDDETLLQTSGTLEWGPPATKGKFRIDADRLTLERVTRFWPGGRTANVGGWLERNARAGEFVIITGELAFDESGVTYDIGFGFENAELSFLPGFPPIQGGRGSGRLGPDSLTIELESGYLEASGVGRADISGSGLEITELSGQSPIGNLTAKSRSSVTFLMHVLKRVTDEFRLPEFIESDSISGTADVSGSLGFPVLRKPGTRGIDYSFSARLADVRARMSRIPGLPDVEDIESADLVVRSDNSGISVAGPVSAGGLRGTVAWRMKRDSSQPRSNVLAIDLDLLPEHLGLLGVEYLEGNFSGTTRLKIEADFNSPEGRVVTATSSLDGMSLSFPELNWSKPPSEKARLVVVRNLDGQEQLYKLRFSAKGLRFDSILEGGTRERIVRLDNFELGNWLKTDIIIRRGPERLQGIELNGGTLDLKGARLGRRTGGEVPVAIAFELDHVLVDDQISLSDVTGRIEPSEGAPGEFAGKINGSIPVSGSFRSRRDGRTIELSADDAGQLLRHTGYFKSAYGGHMNLKILTHDGKDTWDMSFQIRDVRVRDAPVLAEVLNSISVVGLLQQLSGQGLVFDSVTANVKTQPESVSISDFSAVGASMGITLDGWYNPKTKHVDFAGVLSPVNVLTGVLDTLVGTVLNTLVSPGRGNKTFGFNYTMVGPADAPRITVNPLSILTPGKFREIFGSDIPAPPQDGN